MAKQEQFDQTVEYIIDDLEEAGRRVIYDQDQFFEYADGVWRRMPREDEARFDKAIKATCKKTGFPWSTSEKPLKRTLAVELTPDRPVKFDSTPMLVGNNGTLILDTMELINPSPDHYATRRVDVTFDPDASCPQWLAMLDRIFSDKPTDQRVEIIRFLRQWFGVNIVRGPVINGTRELRHGLILHGPPATGKTTISEVFQTLLGKDRVISPALDSLKGEFGLEQLLNSAAIVSDDGIGSDTRVNAGALKRILTGEGMSVNRKFKGAVQFAFNGPVMFTTNEMPRVNESSDALYKRLVVIDVTRQFSAKEAKRDFKGSPNGWTYLADINEYPGILNWAMGGYAEAIHKRRFDVPSSATTASDAFRRSNDPTYDFLRECCEPDEKVQNPRELIAAVASFYSKHQHNATISVRQASTVLNAQAKVAYPSVELKRPFFENRNQTHAFVGLRLNAKGLAYLDLAVGAQVPAAVEHSKRANYARW